MEGLLDLFWRCVIGQPQHHLHFPGRLRRDVLDNLVGELVIGDGDQTVFQRHDARRPDTDFLHGAVNAIDLDAVTRSKRLVDEHRDAAKNVGHEVLRSHGHGQTTNPDPGQKRTDVVPGVGQAGNDAQNPHQRPKRLLQNGAELGDHPAIRAFVKMQNDVADHGVEQPGHKPCDVDRDEDLKHVFHELIHILTKMQVRVTKPKPNDDDAQSDGLFHLVDQDIVPLGRRFGRKTLEHAFEEAVDQARHDDAPHEVSQRLQPLDQRIAQKQGVGQEFHAPNFGQKPLATFIQQVSLPHDLSSRFPPSSPWPHPATGRPWWRSTRTHDDPGGHELGRSGGSHGSQ